MLTVVPSIRITLPQHKRYNERQFTGSMDMFSIYDPPNDMEMSLFLQPDH